MKKTLREWDTINEGMSQYRVQNDKIEIYEIDNFLTDSECNHIIDIIDKNKSRSTTTELKKEGVEESVTSSQRTSSTAFFDSNDEFVKSIDQKISDILGIDMQYGEGNQGSFYEVGQEFKDHTDFFQGEGSEKFLSENGNRVWTFAIYLNDEGLVGGETNFPKAKISVSPKKGKAVTWRNMNSDGTLNDYTTHAGTPVVSGFKYLITKWFRERSFSADGGDIKQRISLKTKITPPKDKFNRDSMSASIAKKYDDMIPERSFRTKEDLPKLSKNGFEKRKLPTHIWKYVQDAYTELKSAISEEDKIDVINSKDYKDKSCCDFMDIERIPIIKEKIHLALHPILQEWIGYDNPISPSTIYGIRSYKKGAVLDMHGDRIETHHAGCVIQIDKKVNEDWSLDIVGHDGITYKVYLEPGEFVLYECAKNEHGRPDPFDGEYFRNLFVHYKLTDWKYVG